MTVHDAKGIRELLPAYVLGALEESERQTVEEHLAANAGTEEGERLDRILFELTEQIGILADEIEPIQPSRMTRARVLGKLPERPPSSTDASPAVMAQWLPWAVAAGLFLVAATLGWQNTTQRRVIADLVTGERRLDAQVATLRGELEQARISAARLAMAQRIVAAPDARQVLLAGLAPAPGASASTYLDPRSGRAIFYAADLAPLAADLTYQLWFIGTDGPVSGGTFAVDERGEASLVVENVLPPDQIAAWAVTVEPAGGVPQPTGEMVLKG